MNHDPLNPTLAPQILSLKDEYTLSFLDFQVIGLYNSSANCWFDIFSLLIAHLSRVAKVSDQVRVTALPEDFLSKNL